MLRMNFNYMGSGLTYVAGLAGISTGLTALLFIILAGWSLIWKGFALWYAARNHQKGWFVFMLIINSAGILEIVYLLWFRADKRKGTASLFEQPPAEGKPVESVDSLPAQTHAESTPSGA
jgi:methionyl-tRNA synthetase